MNSKSFQELIGVIETPSYIFDFDQFNLRCRQIRKIIGDGIDLCYSMKANPFLIDNLPECINKIEVCSPGELLICEHYNILPSNIFFSGVNKNYVDIEKAFTYGVREFTVESYKHLNIINDLGKEKKHRIRVYLRISAETQFGMDIRDVKEVIAHQGKYPYLDICGIHYFSGTQKKKVNTIIKELDFLHTIVLDIKNMYNFNIENIEYGTGLYVEYFDDVENEFEDLSLIKESLYKLSKLAKVTVEMGRFFSASCGYYLTRIDDVKKNDGVNYLIVNGGINQLVYDGQVRAMRKPRIAHLKNDLIQSAANPEEYTICGSLCTTGDVIVREQKLTNPEIGDILVFYNVGAYSCMEGMSTFLSREMPQIWGIINNKVLMLRDFIYTHQFNQK